MEGEGNAKGYLGFGIALFVIIMVGFFVMNFKGTPNTANVADLNATTTATTTEPTAEQIQASLADQIRQNISSLTTEKVASSTGLSVTNVTFVSLDTASVEYTDGKNNYKAEVKFGLVNGEVGVTEFKAVK